MKVFLIKFSSVQIVLLPVKTNTILLKTVMKPLLSDNLTNLRSLIIGQKMFTVYLKFESNHSPMGAPNAADTPAAAPPETKSLFS